MTTTTRPTPAQVRDWMQQRQAEKVPPPCPERIRELLGWHLEANNKGVELAR